MRVWALILLVVIPGGGFSGFSAYWLFRDWAALTASNQQFVQLAAAANSSQTDLMIASAAEQRHRLNCFAEGVGVLLGGVIWAIGIHGLCTLPRSAP